MSDPAARPLPDLLARLDLQLAQRSEAYDRRYFGTVAINAVTLWDLRAALHQCEQELASVTNERDAYRMNLQALAADEERAALARSRLLDALRKYGHHLDWCQMRQPSLLMAGDGPNGCTCGFVAVDPTPAPKEPTR